MTFLSADLSILKNFNFYTHHAVRDIIIDILNQNLKKKFSNLLEMWSFGFGLFNVKSLYISMWLVQSTSTYHCDQYFFMQFLYLTYILMKNDAQMCKLHLHQKNEQHNIVMPIFHLYTTSWPHFLCAWLNHLLLIICAKVQRALRLIYLGWTPAEWVWAWNVLY